MASGAAATAAAAVSVFAILVLSSLGNQETGPLCSSSCGSWCTTKCTDEIFNSCKSYCENPLAARQSCEKQIFKACTVSFCCNNNCSSDCFLEAKNSCSGHDCILEAKNGCQYVQNTTIACESCRARILQSCVPACYSDCSSTCVEK